MCRFWHRKRAARVDAEPLKAMTTVAVGSVTVWVDQHMRVHRSDGSEPTAADMYEVFPWMRPRPKCGSALENHGMNDACLGPSARSHGPRVQCPEYGGTYLSTDLPDARRHAQTHGDDREAGTVTTSQ